MVHQRVDVGNEQRCDAQAVNRQHDFSVRNSSAADPRARGVHGAANHPDQRELRRLAIADLADEVAGLEGGFLPELGQDFPAELLQKEGGIRTGLIDLTEVGKGSARGAP